MEKEIEIGDNVICPINGICCKVLSIGGKLGRIAECKDENGKKYSFDINYLCKIIFYI